MTALWRSRWLAQSVKQQKDLAPARVRAHTSWSHLFCAAMFCADWRLVCSTEWNLEFTFDNVSEDYMKTNKMWVTLKHAGMRTCVTCTGRVCARSCGLTRLAFAACLFCRVQHHHWHADGSACGMPGRTPLGPLVPHHHKQPPQRRDQPQADRQWHGRGS